MSDLPPLSDQYGKPLRPKEDRPLPVEIQNAVKIEVNTAMDQARQDLKSDFDNLRKGSLIRYAVTVAVGAAAAILGYLNLLDKAETWTHDFVRDNMNKPMLDRAAGEVMDSRIAPYVSNEVAIATRRVETLHEEFTQLAQARDALQAEIEFNLLANRAQLYDAEAYEKLVQLGQGTNATASQSRRIVSDIQRRLEYDRFSSTAMLLKEQIGDMEYTGPFTSDEIAVRLRWVGLEGPANYIREHKLKQFVPELVQATVASKDLSEANRVTLALSELTGQKFYAWSVSQLTNWWNANRAAYTNWPFAAFDGAMDAYSGARYSGALTNFQAVLASDQTADMSRTYAIACALESSNLQLATNLFSSFADPKGRWRKLAEAKMCAATGGVTTATSKLVALSTNYPTFQVYSRNSHVWRQIVWGLFDRLTTTNKQSSAVQSNR